MERSYGKLTPKMTESLRTSPWTGRATFQLSLPLVAGVGHRLTDNSSGKELLWETQLYCTILNFPFLIPPHWLVRYLHSRLSYFKQHMSSTLRLIFLHSLYLKGYPVVSYVCWFDFLLSSHLIVNQNLYCLSPYETALLSTGIIFKKM